MKRYKLLTFLICVFYSLFLVFCFNGYAQTAEDLYNRAVNKYFLGDSEGALKDLSNALKLDPNLIKARELQTEIQKELGGITTTTLPALVPTPAVSPVLTPAPPKVKILPAPKPKKVQPQPTPRPKEKVEKPLPPPIFHPYKIKAPQVLFPTPLALLWVAAALLTIFYVAVRYTIYYLQLVIERRSIQICSECKYSNPSSAEFCAKCGSRLKPWVGVTAAQKKWYAKFNWKKNPFTLDIMPKLFTGYQSQVNTIFEKVYLKTGHILVLGKKGTGKTTLLKWLTEILSKEFNTVYIPRPTDNFEDLLEYMAKSLKLRKGRREKITVYDMEAIASQTRKNILLLLDEAHEFYEEFERPLRTLGDLNGINFVMAGLPEASEKIKEISPPFFDRVIQEVILDHLTLEETIELIKKRIEDAGGSGTAPLTPEAIENIFKMTGGIPRLILKVCDWVIADAIRNNLERIEVTAAEGLPKETFVEEEKKEDN